MPEQPRQYCCRTMAHRCPLPRTNLQESRPRCLPRSWKRMPARPSRSDLNMYHSIRQQAISEMFILLSTRPRPPGWPDLGGFAGRWWRSCVLSRNSRFGNDHGDHQRAWVPGAGCPCCSRTAMGRRLWMRSGMRILICTGSRRSTRYTDLAALPDHLTMLTRKYGPAHLSLNPASAWSSK